jgi:hypothetical protein
MEITMASYRNSAALKRAKLVLKDNGVIYNTLNTSTDNGKDTS